MKPRISIVTPTFNSEDTICRTLDSILKQDYPNIECIIVDNESDDKTIGLVEAKLRNRLDYRVICEKDQGISDAFSKGIRNSSGEVIGILNSDDEYCEIDAISRIMNCFVDEKVDFVHGDMQFIDESYGSVIRKPLLCSLIYAMPYNHPTFFVRKKVYDEIGLFKNNYRYAMDFELICRMYKTADKPRFMGTYVSDKPLVKMYSGGASWKHELKSIDEVERALKEYGFWNLKAFCNQFNRRLRIRIKNILNFFGINYPIKLWRQFKWR